MAVSSDATDQFVHTTITKRLMSNSPRLANFATCSPRQVKNGRRPDRRIRSNFSRHLDSDDDDDNDCDDSVGSNNVNVSSVGKSLQAKASLERIDDDLDDQVSASPALTDLVATKNVNNSAGLHCDSMTVNMGSLENAVEDQSAPVGHLTSCNPVIAPKRDRHAELGTSSRSRNKDDVDNPSKSDEEMSQTTVAATTTSPVVSGPESTSVVHIPSASDRCRNSARIGSLIAHFEGRKIGDGPPPDDCPPDLASRDRCQMIEELRRNLYFHESLQKSCPAQSRSASGLGNNGGPFRGYTSYVFISSAGDTVHQGGDKAQSEQVCKLDHLPQSKVPQAQPTKVDSGTQTPTNCAVWRDGALKSSNISIVSTESSDVSSPQSPAVDMSADGGKPSVPTQTHVDSNVDIMYTVNDGITCSSATPFSQDGAINRRAMWRAPTSIFSNSVAKEAIEPDSLYDNFDEADANFLVSGDGELVHDGQPINGLYADGGENGVDDVDDDADHIVDEMVEEYIMEDPPNVVYDIPYGPNPYLTSRHAEFMLHTIIEESDEDCESHLGANSREANHGQVMAKLADDHGDSLSERCLVRVDDSDQEDETMLPGHLAVVNKSTTSKPVDEIQVGSCLPDLSSSAIAKVDDDLDLPSVDSCHSSSELSPIGSDGSEVQPEQVKKHRSCDSGFGGVATHIHPSTVEDVSTEESDEMLCHLPRDSSLTPVSKDGREDTDRMSTTSSSAYSERLVDGGSLATTTDSSGSPKVDDNPIDVGLIASVRPLSTVRQPSPLSPYIEKYPPVGLQNGSPRSARQSVTLVRGEVHLVLTWIANPTGLRRGRQLDKQQHHWWLDIVVVACRDLAPVDVRRNRSDPYVKIYLLPDKSRTGKQKTKVKKHTLSPIFDERMRFYLGCAADVMSLTRNRTIWLSVWHSDTFGRNIFLGHCLLALSDSSLIESASAGRWFGLQPQLTAADDVDNRRAMRRSSGKEDTARPRMTMAHSPNISRLSSPSLNARPLTHSKTMYLVLALKLSQVLTDTDQVRRFILQLIVRHVDGWGGASVGTTPNQPVCRCILRRRRRHQDSNCSTSVSDLSSASSTTSADRQRDLATLLDGQSDEENKRTSSAVRIEADRIEFSCRMMTWRFSHPTFDSDRVTDESLEVTLWDKRLPPSRGRSNSTYPIDEPSKWYMVGGARICRKTDLRPGALACPKFEPSSTAASEAWSRLFQDHDGVNGGSSSGRWMETRIDLKPGDEMNAHLTANIDYLI